MTASANRTPRSEAETGALSLFRDAVPLYVAMLATSIAATVDVALLGQRSTEELAAFTVAMAVFVPCLTAINAFTRGLAPFVVDAADDRRALTMIIRDALVLSVVVATAGAFALAAAPGLGRIAGAGDIASAVPTSLLVLLAVALFVNAAGMTAVAALVGLRRNGAVLRAGFAGAVVAVGASVTLIPGSWSFPALGLDGAGIAMVASAATSAVVAGVPLLGLVRRAHPLDSGGMPTTPTLAALAKVSVPLSATVLIKFAVLGVLALAAAGVGATEAAAQSVAGALAALLFTVAVAIGLASVAPIAQRLKEGDARATRATAWASVRLASTVVGVAGLVVLICDDLVVRVFVEAQDVRREVGSVLALVVVAAVLDAMQAAWGFGLVGLKRTRPSAWAFAACYGLLAISAFPVASRWGLTGLWVAVVIANALLVVGQAGAFHRLSAPLIASDQAGRQDAVTRSNQ